MRDPTSTIDAEAQDLERLARDVFREVRLADYDLTVLVHGRCPHPPRRSQVRGPDSTVRVRGRKVDLELMPDFRSLALDDQIAELVHAAIHVHLEPVLRILEQVADGAHLSGVMLAAQGFLEHCTESLGSAFAPYVVPEIARAQRTRVEVVQPMFIRTPSAEQLQELRRIIEGDEV